MKVYAFLPAKGSSNRIPNKNVVLLDGEPLFLTSLKKLTRIESIDAVVLDSEDSRIFELSSEVDCEKLVRDETYASNRTDGNALLRNEVDHYPDGDIYVQLLCTSPFIEEATIAKGIEILKTQEEYDSVIAVRKEKLYLWNKDEPVYDVENIPNSEDLDSTTIESMGLYIVRGSVVKETGRRVGRRPYLLELNPLEAIDVNWPDDFELANLIAVGKREKERRLFQNLKILLSSSVLSDVLDELGLKGVFSSSFRVNIPGAKMLGRAKTMKIEEMVEGESYKKIYESLSLYDSVVSNDVIVVANDVPEFAFFGELNANLAIRSGAAGAIIDGVTRDSNETVAMSFPVFSKGNYCKDTRGRGVIRSMNKKVSIDGVYVSKDDLIFGDSDGIIAIPRDHEKKVLELALERIAAEKGIIISIAKGELPDKIIGKYGYF